MDKDAEQGGNKPSEIVKALKFCLILDRVWCEQKSSRKSHQEHEVSCQKAERTFQGE